MKNNSLTNTSAELLLQSATQLFALYGYDGVSVKQIASQASMNSALISYYYGGKKNLYLKVLNTQMNVFRDLIRTIKETDAEPLTKLRNYVDALAKFQEDNPNHLHLIFREILSPQPMFQDFVKTKLYLLHTFMTELVTEALNSKEIHTDIRPTHVAFTLEGIILFYFLMHKEVAALGNFEKGKETDYLYTALDSYLNSLK